MGRESELEGKAPERGGILLEEVGKGPVRCLTEKVGGGRASEGF